MPPTRDQIAAAVRRVTDAHFGDGSGRHRTVPLTLLEPPSDRSQGPCAFFGEPTGDTITCGPCGGKVKYKTFRCGVHGTCVPKKGKLTAPTVGCDRCTSFVSSAGAPPAVDYGPAGKRHLLYHVLPVSGNGVWRRGVRNLLLRWKTFTGTKLVSVAQGPPVRERIDPTEGVPAGLRVLPLEPFDVVRKEFPPDTEFVTVRNDPHTWERASWSALWEPLLSGADPSDIVLYAHAKGTTRKVTSPVHEWAEMMYTLALDHMPRVEAVLRTKPVCGSIVKWGRFFGGQLISSRWHYSGNFWWGRIGALRDKMRDHPLVENAWAAEAWVGTAFHPSECGVVFQPTVPFTHLYKPGDCERVLADFDLWCRSHPLTIDRVAQIPDTTTS